jgi:uncharacterized membrane protein YgaE (UPF0421/DUF939 family)
VGREVNVAITLAFWFVKNWKVSIGIVVAIAIAIFLFKLERSGYERRVQEEAQEQVIILQRRLGALQLTAAADAKRAEENMKRIAELEEKARETPPNAAACLDRDAARRVRAIR